MAGVRNIPEIMHRTLFRTVSLLGRGQSTVLGRYFDWWHRTPDPWKLATDEYEQYKYRTTLEQLPDRPYRSILDVGCSEGVFTCMLAENYPEARVTGLDISARALERARARGRHLADRLSFARADLLTPTHTGTHDLVFCAETLYYLGREERLRLAATRLGGFLAPGGLLVAVHPWPEARRLHGPLDSASGMSKLSEHVDEETHRPFAVSIYQAES